MSNKPSWSTAPEWANWLAADLTIDAGRPEAWVWFENKPIYNGCGWMFADGDRHGRWLQTSHKIPLLFDAKNSLEPRP